MPGMNQPSIPPSQGISELLSILEVVQNKDAAKAALSEMKDMWKKIQEDLEASADLMSKSSSAKEFLEKEKAELSKVSETLKEEKRQLKEKAQELESKALELMGMKKQFQMDAEAFKESANAQVLEMSKREQKIQKDSLIAETAKIEAEKLLQEYQEKMAKLKALAGG